MFKISFNYAKNMLLRTASLIVEATNHKQARDIAEAKLKELGHKWFQITNVTKLT